MKQSISVAGDIKIIMWCWNVLCQGLAGYFWNHLWVVAGTPDSACGWFDHPAVMPKGTQGCAHSMTGVGSCTVRSPGARHPLRGEKGFLVGPHWDSTSSALCCFAWLACREKPWLNLGETYLWAFVRGKCLPAGWYMLLGNNLGPQPARSREVAKLPLVPRLWSRGRCWWGGPAGRAAVRLSHKLLLFLLTADAHPTCSVLCWNISRCCRLGSVASIHNG